MDRSRTWVVESRPDLRLVSARGWGFLIVILIRIILVVVASLIVASAGVGDPTF